MLLPAVMDVDLNSVPGMCSLSRLGTTNKQVFGVTDQGFSVERLCMVRAAVKDRFDQVCRGEAYADPLKVFIKQEPHKQSKIDSNRLRLIMSVSLVDALVDRVLFMRLMHRVVQRHPQTLVMIGWSPVQGGYRLLQHLFDMHTISIDKKAWDWSVPAWLLNAVKEVLYSLAPDAPEWWYTAVDTRFRCLFEKAKFGFQDGQVVEQMAPGIMKSGCYLTIFINSVGQLILHEMARVAIHLEPSDVEPIVVLGDDSLQRWFPEYELYVDYLSHLGFSLEVEKHAKVSEFAGFRFEANYTPAYRQKHLFMLSHLRTMDRTICVQTLQNYQILYYFVPGMMKILKEMIRILDMPEALVDERNLRAIALG